MATTKITKDQAEELINQLSKIHKKRQKALEVILRVDKKTSDYKMRLFKEKIEKIL